MGTIDRRSLLSGTALLVAATPAAGTSSKPAEVNATEDLMREHGVIRRTLGVYEELARRLRTAGENAPREVLGQAARLMARFGEGYHEKLEETEVFPKLVQVGQQKSLIDVLLAQHEAGRAFTRTFLAVSTESNALGQPAQRTHLAGQLEEFSRMYQAHAAREDTVVFQAFRALFSARAFEALGDRFEDQETKLLGSHGFEKALEEVGQLERAVGIDDLAKYTAHP